MNVERQEQLLFAPGWVPRHATSVVEPGVRPRGGSDLGESLTGDVVVVAEDDIFVTVGSPKTEEGRSDCSTASASPAG